MPSRERKLSNFHTIRELARNRLSKKVAVEASLSFATAFPPLLSFGTAIIGSVNMYNAGLELHHAWQGNKGASFTRSLLYAGFGLFEFGLFAAGSSILGPLEGRIFHHFGWETPDLLNIAGGITASGLIGMATGLVTNTTWYEAKRKGLIPYTPADVIFSRRLGRRNL